LAEAPSGPNIGRDFLSGGLKHFLLWQESSGAPFGFFSSACLSEEACLGNQLSSIEKISVSPKVSRNAQWTFLQFANVFGQGVGLKQFQRLLVDTVYVLARFRA